MPFKFSLNIVVTALLVLSSATQADISINGKTYRGNNISINGGTVIIDGEVIESSDTTLSISFVGDIGNVISDQTLSVTGNILGNVEAGGSINAGDIGGDASAGGAIDAGFINGSARAGGSINCQ